MMFYLLVKFDLRSKWDYHRIVSRVFPLCMNLFPCASQLFHVYAKYCCVLKDDGSLERLVGQLLV